MAQAIYDGHPLDNYLRDNGDIPEYVPGAYPGASDEELDDTGVLRFQRLILSSRYAAFAIQVLRHWTNSLRTILPSSSDDLAERFRYDLISSGLLASSLPSTPVTSRPHSRIPSLTQRVPGELTLQSDAIEHGERERKSMTGVFLATAFAALLNQYRLVSVLFMIASFVFSEPKTVLAARRNYGSQVFELLEHLKVAGSVWDAAVNDAITIIAREERRARHTTSSSMSPTPSSTLRVALHSTLITTQHQCDNVRPLLAALSSPTELSQLSEMYAPPSPKLQSLALQARASTPSRKHQSLPEAPTESLASPQSPRSSKRNSWAGLQSSSSPRSPSLYKNRDRRRSDIGGHLQTQTQSSPTAVVTSPRPQASPSLSQVLEVDEELEIEKKDSADITLDEEDLPRDNFGTAALYLRRKRRASAFDALGLSFSRSDPSLRNSVHSGSSSISSARFTSMSTNRHPLSLSALDNALQGAIASRRYACAHLLALRFREDADDESYWDNVRSVTELLTSTLQDAGARLNEALAEAEDISRQEAEPTPDGSPKSPCSDRLFGLSPGCPIRELANISPSPPQRLSEILQFPLQTFPASGTSFAPVPSGMMRFATHMDAISSSLGDAKGYLAETLGELKEFQQQIIGAASSDTSAEAKATEESVMQAYDRLRRELGVALREYERGRLTLVDIFSSRRIQIQTNDDSAEEYEDLLASNLKRMDNDSLGSGDSRERSDFGPLTPGDGSPIMPTFRSLRLVAELSTARDPAGKQDVEDDDATQHLLLGASSSNLPPPGTEHVYEADSDSVGVFTRERSKLTREERIKQMKANRESMTGRGLAAQLEDESDVNRPQRHSWGPSTDVVDELKDVIWKVGERRRKMTGETRKRRASLIPLPFREPSLEQLDKDTGLIAL